MPILSPSTAEQIIQWAVERVRLHLRRHGVRLTLGGGQLGDTFVGVDEIQRSLGGAGRFDLTDQLGLHPTTTPEAPFPDAPDGPCAILAERFGLDAMALRLLVAAAAPALSIDVERLYTFAWADFSRRRPTPAFLAELVSDTADAALDALAAFDPGAALATADLIRFEADADGPVAHRGLTIPSNVVRFLRGAPMHLPRPVTDALLTPTGPDTVPTLLARLLTRGATRILLRGEPGVGRLAALERALDGGAVIATDLDALPPEPPRLSALLTDLVREARLRDATLYLRGDALFADPEDPRLPVIASAIRNTPGRVVFAARNAIGRLRTGARVHQVDFPLPPRTAQRDLWIAALSARGVEDTDVADRLVQRFNVSPGTIDAAVAAAADDAAIADEAITVAHLARAMRQRINHALDAVAEPMSTTLDWDDVVLPEAILETLHEIRAQARNRLKVFDEWGFRRKLAYGRGLACLFTGPPGTGKTMMAGIIAKDLGRELYRVDLSRVVSKWVGETEKNLSRIFDEAERAQVILFFDEADSLFSTRTEVKGANDRFANMEVNYLLQRMESFDGMTILTTNFERGLDEAFRRRLRFRVHFPLPDASERAALWSRMIPPQTPVDGTINFAGLGKRYKLSGGNIKNAVLRAAFYAAEAGSGLTTALLVKAAEAESREMGRL